MITLKRVYDPVSRTAGTRFLVERVASWYREGGPESEVTTVDRVRFKMNDGLSKRKD